MGPANADAAVGRARRRRSRPARAGLLVATLATVAGLGLLASACGGSSVPQVAQASSANPATDGSASSGSGEGDASAYSACMRTNGVPAFPDPDGQGRIKITSGRRANGQVTGVDVTSPQFRKAQRACQSLQPKGGRPSAQQQAQDQQAMLDFSRCMRSHGVPKFPDPTFLPSGGSRMTIGKDSGVDPGTPRFQAAQRACRQLVPDSPLSAGPAEGTAP